MAVWICVSLVISETVPLALCLSFGEMSIQCLSPFLNQIGFLSFFSIGLYKLFMYSGHHPFIRHTIGGCRLPPRRCLSIPCCAAWSSDVVPLALVPLFLVSNPKSHHPDQCQGAHPLGFHLGVL